MLKNSKNLLSYDYNGATSFYLGSIIVTLLIQAAGGVVSSALVKTYPNVASNGDFNTAFMIAVQLANFAFIYFYTKIKRYKFDFTFVFRDGDGKGITPAVIIVPVFAALFLMIGMYLPTVWFGELVRVMGVPEGYGNIELVTPSSVAMIVIASVFLAPMFEETIYRGVLLHGLMREKTALRAVMLSALAFMLMHMNPIQVVFQFALGAVGGFIAVKSKRLLPSVVLHATANALALVMQMTPLAGYLAAFVAWNMSHPVAAAFITLGLFAAAGGVLFVMIKCAFTHEKLSFRFGRKNSVEAKGESSAENNVAGDDVKTSDTITESEVRRKIARSNGTFKYWIAAGICIVMLIVNFVTAVLS